MNKINLKSKMAWIEIDEQCEKIKKKLHFINYR